MKNIYWHNQGRNFFVGLSKCFNCDIDLNKSFVLRVVSMRSKNEDLLYHYCGKCADEIAEDSPGIMQQWLNLIVVNEEEELPKDSIIFDVRRRRMADSKQETVFTKAIKQEKDEVIVDKTKHALRESWEGASIGLPDSELKKIEEKKNLELGTEDGIKKYLDSFI